MGLAQRVIDVDLGLEVEGGRVVRVEHRAGGQDGGVRVQRDAGQHLGGGLRLRRQVGEGDVGDAADRLLRHRVELRALDDVALTVNQVEVLVQDEVAGAGVEHLVAGRVAQREQAVAIDGHVRGAGRILDGALLAVARDGGDAHAVADLVGDVRARHADGLGEHVREGDVLALEAQRVDVGDVVADHAHRLAIRGQAAGTNEQCVEYTHDDAPLC